MSNVIYQTIVGYCLPYSFLVPFGEKQLEYVKTDPDTTSREKQLEDLMNFSNKLVTHIKTKKDEMHIENVHEKMFVDSSDVSKSYFFIFDSKNSLGKSEQKVDGPKFSVTPISTTADSFIKDLIMEFSLNDYKLFSQIFKKSLFLIEFDEKSVRQTQ